MWYEKAKEDFCTCGFVELEFALAAFVKLGKRNRQVEVVAILCPRVDDGFLTAELGEDMDAVKSGMNKPFLIKEWMGVGQDPFSFLAMRMKKGWLSKS